MDSVKLARPSLPFLQISNRVTRLEFLILFCLFKLSSVHMAGPGHNNFFSTNDIRAYSSAISKNSKPFTTWYPPANYPIGLTLFDINYQKDLRIKSYFDSVKFNESTQAFDTALHLDALGDTIMYTTACTWFDNFKHDRDFQHGTLTIKGSQLTQAVSFPTEFASNPEVVVWLSGFDVVSRTGEWRFEVNANDITTKGFNVVGDVWGTTQLNTMDVTWIAYPASRPNIDSGWFNTMELRDWQKPQFLHSQQINFRKKFERVPRVYFALNRIDSFHSNRYNLRLQAYITDVNTTGMTAHLESWYENNMYSTAGNWIAVQDY